MDEKRKMQSILNHSLSGLKENPFLAQRVIEQAKGEPEMKKKISFALILAMILLIGRNLPDCRVCHPERFIHGGMYSG